MKGDEAHPAARELRDLSRVARVVRQLGVRPLICEVTRHGRRVVLLWEDFRRLFAKRSVMVNFSLERNVTYYETIVDTVIVNANHDGPPSASPWGPEGNSIDVSPGACKGPKYARSARDVRAAGASAGQERGNS